ncbi:MAG: phosphotransferase [Candidatus Gracilibacteria bacterium]
MNHPNTKDLKLLGKGEAYTVYELNFETILRIRYTGEKYQNYGSEQKLLSCLHNQAKIFPQLLEYNEDGDWGIYTRIHGASASSYISHASIEEMQDLTKEICDTLQVLHSIAPETLLGLGYTDLRSTSSGNLDWLRGDIKNKLSGFPENVVKNILQYINELETYNYPHPTMTHGDISLENIIVDPNNGRLAGIIDFSDARVADPALDFDNLGRLSEYAWAYLGEHIDVYSDIVSLKKRAEFYSKRRYLFSYLYNFKHRSEDDILWVFGASFELEPLL